MLRFYKMTGSGNDFVFLDGREHRLEQWPSPRIAAFCDRRNGAGGDGLVVVTPEREGVRMVYFNADGSRAGMCGNAALCSTRFAARFGLVSGHEVNLYTDSGLVRARCVGPGWAAEILLPDFQLPAPVPLAIKGREQWMDLCSVGVPHLVIFSDQLGAVDVPGRGKALRDDPTFQPEGVNVNFIGKAVSGSDPVWQLRTYERGVEAETLACGTGTIAAAFALAQRGLDQLPIRIRSWGGGGNAFSVAGRIEPGASGGPGWAREPWLCGEGRLVFEGTWQE